MSRSRRTGRDALVTMAMVIAGALTVGLAQDPVAARFTTTSADNGNSVSSAVSFCTAPGTATLTASDDSYVEEGSPSGNRNGDSMLRVRSNPSVDVRVWIRFTLPARPAGCSVGSASLRAYNHTPSPVARTIDVLRGAPAPAWAETTITWANQPAVAGTPVGSPSPVSADWQEWNVRAHVLDQYAYGNNGFVLKDHVDHSNPQNEQLYYTRTNATYAPVLVIVWS